MVVTSLEQKGRTLIDGDDYAEGLRRQGNTVAANRLQRAIRRHDPESIVEDLLGKKSLRNANRARYRREKGLKNSA